MKSQSKFIHFHSCVIQQNAIENVVCQIGGHFVQGGDEVNYGRPPFWYLAITVTIYCHSNINQWFDIGAITFYYMNKSNVKQYSTWYSLIFTYCWETKVSRDFQDFFSILIIVHWWYLVRHKYTFPSYTIHRHEHAAICWDSFTRTTTTFPYWGVIAMGVHYNDVIMGAIASQITNSTIIYSTVYSSAASLAFVRGIHRWPVNSLHKWPVTQKMFPFDDVIMWSGLPRMV